MENRIKKVFEEVPKTYELVNHVLTFCMDIMWRRKAVDIAAAGGGGAWMDVCSGTGETAVLLKKRAKAGTKVLSVDFCLPMLEMAAAKPEGRDIRFVLADAANLPFEDGSFDLVTISFATRNLNLSRDALAKTFREFSRVLRPGGRFVNLETSQPGSKIIRKIFHAYVRLFVRPVGEWISGSRAGYAYLSQTIPRFYNAEELSEIMKSAGFSGVKYQKMMFGAAAIHEALK